TALATCAAASVVTAAASRRRRVGFTVSGIDVSRARGCGISDDVPGVPASALLVGMKDVVLGLHGHMARMSAVRGTRVGRELVGCRLVVEERVSPSAGLRKA